MGPSAARYPLVAALRSASSRHARGPLVLEQVAEAPADDEDDAVGGNRTPAKTAGGRVGEPNESAVVMLEIWLPSRSDARTEPLDRVGDGT
jgi:hypothetical protein